MPSFSAAICSPYIDLSFLMNCTAHTFMPRPQARNMMPNAAVLLPLPMPVLTMTSPFRLTGRSGDGVLAVRAVGIVAIGVS